MFNNIKKTIYNKKILYKLLSVLLITLLTFINFILVGQHLGKELISYAIGNDLNNQNNKTNVDNVRFDVYLDANDTSKISVEKEINDNDTKLYIQVTVQGGGVLKEGNILFGDTNFVLSEETDNEKLKLDIIPSGQGITIEIPIKAIKQQGKFNLSLLDMISTIKLVGKYTNNDGEVVDINSEKNVKIVWTSPKDLQNNNPVLVNQEVITNKIFEINGINKRIVQVLVKSELQDSVYPIKETNIEIDVPKFGGELPEDIQVSSINGANATNGKTGITKVENISAKSDIANSWSFDNRNNKINIKSTNLPNNNNNISWKSSGVDEFVITYVYKENTSIDSITSDVISSIVLHDKYSTLLTKKDIMFQEDIKEFSNVSVLDIAITNSAYKSSMNVKNDIDYMTKLSIGINYADVINSFNIITSKDIMNNNKEARIYDKTYYKATYINKEEFLELFGAEGSIEIYNNSAQELLFTVNNNLETDENGNIVLRYPENVTDILIKTTKPILEGKLNIFSRKTIKVEELTQGKIEDIRNLKTRGRAYRT